MPKRAVVVGAGVAGLAGGVALARRGWSVTLVDRDPSCASATGDEAFVEWERRDVPQFRHAHAFSARSRNLLSAWLPDVVERLHDDGVEAQNLFKLLAPPAVWLPGDDDFTGFVVRRPPFELALLRTAEAQPGLELRRPAAVAGLTYDVRADAPPRVTGVRLASGETLPADVVLDCAGRRSPLPRWLAEDVGVEVPQELQDCDAVYLTRYYRQRPESELSPLLLVAIRGRLERLGFLGFMGDHRSYAVAFLVLPDDDDLRVLRHAWAFEAAARSIPMLAPWVDPATCEPINRVEVMAGHVNVRRRYVVGGRPIVTGLLAAGDSLCTTNPAYGWGASMALTHAFAAVQAVETAPEPATATVAYAAAVDAETDGVYRESAAMDRLGSYEWRRLEVPEHDRDEMERQRLVVEGIFPGVLRDAVLARAFLRRAHLIEAPDAILDDPEVRDRAAALRTKLASRPAPVLGPTRAELLDILRAADPAAAPALA